MRKHEGQIGTHPRTTQGSSLIGSCYCEPQSGNQGSTWDNEDLIIPLDQSAQSDLKPGVPAGSGDQALEAVEGELPVRSCVVHNVIPPR